MNTQGDSVIRFIETFLTLGGSFYGQPFELLDFQKDLLRDIYLLDDEGRRKHRTYLLGLPRKNGKTSLAAALGVYHLIADSADTAPVAIAAAGDRQQARLVLNHVAGCKDDQHARQHDRCLEVLGHVGIAECPTD